MAVMMHLEKKIQYQFKNKNLLQQAFTHKSVFRKEKKKGVSLSTSSRERKKASKANLHNERLEFLGDAVLSLSMADILMKEFPQCQEGSLSKIRATLVSEKILAKVAVDLDLHQWIRLGKEEEEKLFIVEKPRLLASLFEALVGAYFLDSSYLEVNAFIKRIFTPLIQKGEVEKYLKMDFKTHFQEKCQKMYQKAPTYVVVHEEGPDHNKVFYVKVWMNNQCLAEGRGFSKKEAEQEAAKKGLESLKKGSFHSQKM